MILSNSEFPAIWLGVWREIFSSIVIVEKLFSFGF